MDRLAIAAMSSVVPVYRTPILAVELEKRPDYDLPNCRQNLIARATSEKKARSFSESSTKVHYWPFARHIAPPHDLGHFVSEADIIASRHQVYRYTA